MNLPRISLLIDSLASGTESVAPDEVRLVVADEN